MNFFDVILVRRSLHLLYRTFKEKLKIQGYSPFKLGFVLTTTCIMLFYENVSKSGTN